MSYHLRVKICGVTNRLDAGRAAVLGADAIGLNFYPKSPRCVDAVAAHDILRELPPCTAAIGVFVNEPLHEVVSRVQALGRLQRHPMARREAGVERRLSIPSHRRVFP